MSLSKVLRWALLLFWTLLFSQQTVLGQHTFKIFLVGDAGDLEESGETLLNLRKELLSNPNSAVVFLGDNSYKNILGGIIPFGYKGFDSSRNTIDKINAQLALLDHYRGSVFFTPGNHDWWNKLKYEQGRSKLAMEEAFISKNLSKNPTIANPSNVFLPKNGEYGPAYVELQNKSIRLIFIDTYRLITMGLKNNKVSPDGIFFYQRLDSIIHDGYLLNQKIVIAAHHPVYSLGRLNKILSHPNFLRRIKASYMQFPTYKTMAFKIDSILRRYPGIYYVSGHLHALQYFYTKDHVHYIISGAGSKENKVSEKEIALYNEGLLPNDFLVWNSGGFFELEFDPGTVNTFLFYDNGLLKCALEN